MGRAGELKRPILSEGPLKELNDALHELHLDAGLPTLSTMYRELNKRISRSSLHDALTSTARPPWDTVVALVEILGTRSIRTSAEQEIDRFQKLWKAAAQSVIADEPAPSAPDGTQSVSTDDFWIIATDIVGNSAASDPEQAELRARLYHAVAEALDFAGIRSSFQVDRGDGQLTLVPFKQSRLSSLLGFLLHMQRLVAEADRRDTQLRLCVVVTRGAANLSNGGWWGYGIVRATRLLDAVSIRRLMHESEAVLTVALTESVHDQLEELKPRGFRPQFHHLRAETKEGSISMWAYQGYAST